jgi:hypothetical protein
VRPIEPPAVRYIKLGEQNRWAARAIERGELAFGYASVPHDPCLRGDWDEVRDILMLAEGYKQKDANNALREIRDFYTLDASCLWITIFKKRLWWAFADPAVIWLEGGDPDRGIRVRRAIDGWHNVSINGEALKTDTLSTKLTQLAAYRMTICSVAAADYLLRRINAIAEPVITKALDARRLMIETADEMIRGLHWAEFEIMVDLIFARGGWQRVSVLGGTAADVDLELKHPTTGETAFVQVKSRASQAVLDDYIARYRAAGRYDRMFLVCHSPKGRWKAEESSDIHLWLGATLAERAISAGLYDWLIERSR